MAVANGVFALAQGKFNAQHKEAWPRQAHPSAPHWGQNLGLIRSMGQHAIDDRAGGSERGFYI